MVFFPMCDLIFQHVGVFPLQSLIIPNERFYLLVSFLISLFKKSTIPILTEVYILPT